MKNNLNRKKIQIVIAVFLIIFGLLLLSVNLFGLFTDIRKKNLDKVSPENLRFQNEEYLTYKDSLKQLKSIENENGIDYALKANQLVQKSLTHIEWNKVDPVEFRQLVPIWENYLLYFLGILSNEPQIKRYHFVDYNRSIERGIGICGDASMVLSQILDKKGIENEIVSYNGHVITQANFNSDWKILLDPDFGVVLNMSLEELSSDPSRAYPYYLDAGYTGQEARALVRIYGRKYTAFDNVYAFMPKRYIFEYLSYILKWLIPIFLLLISALLLRIDKQHNRSSQVH